jgi:hypothetical protein
MKRTRVCDLLGIDYPILQGGMLWLATAELAAAVSNAGAPGIISPLAGMEKNGDPLENLRLQIIKALIRAGRNGCLSRGDQRFSWLQPCQKRTARGPPGEWRSLLWRISRFDKRDTPCGAGDPKTRRGISKDYKENSLIFGKDQPANGGDGLVNVEESRRISRWCAIEARGIPARR